MLLKVFQQDISVKRYAVGQVALAYDGFIVGAHGDMVQLNARQ